MIFITKILVIDDSPFACTVIDKALRSKDVSIFCVHTAGEAFEWVSQQTPDCILLDLVLPDMSGHEVCERLIQQYQLVDIPILFITSDREEKSLLLGFAVGGADYICKPFSEPELKARVSSHLKSKLMKDELKLAYAKLEAAMTEIRLQGMKDPLTNLFNRRYFLENMAQWREASAAGGFFVLLFDVDRFKQINDVYGHCTGDYVLYTIADLTTQSIGENAVVGRWGGDEFLVILAESSVEKAEAVAGKLVSAIAGYDFCYDEKHLSSSISLGMSRFDPALDIERNISNTDEALYAAKSAGRNRFAFYGDQNQENDE